MISSPDILKDQWGRQMDYLRIAVTDRCNLRCFYCMPEEGINYLPKKELLSYEEIIRLSEIFCQLGVTKIRITGGEPFVRKDLVPFLNDLKQISGLENLHITTNGVLTQPYIGELETIGISGINLSLDSLDKENFFKITRRNEFDTVRQCLDSLIDSKIPIKINMVVMRGLNDHEIIPMAELALDQDIQIRFIEEMPFNGRTESNQKLISHAGILQILEDHFGHLDLHLKNDSSDPASLYSTNELEGKLGIIPAFSRTFCGSCNRIRLTATGTIKNCLYDEGVFDLKAFLRSGASDQEIGKQLTSLVHRKEKKGVIAESKRTHHQSINESMSEIGG